MRPPRWTRDATDVDDVDLSALLDGDRALAELVADASDALDEEVEVVVARARQAAAPRRPPIGPRVAWISLVAAVAAALLLLLGPAAPPRPPAPALVGARIEAPSPPADGALPLEEVRFVATGDGPWTVARRDATETVVVQRGGVVTYDVEPLPAGRRFRVLAGGLEVEVVGTSFTVGFDGLAPWVSVHQGRVVVREAGGEHVLGAGDRFPPWARPEEVARSAEPVREEVAPPPPPTAPLAARPEVELAALTDQVDAGERSGELAAALAGWARANPTSPLAHEAEVAALDVGAAALDPRVSVTTIGAWLAAHPDSPRREALLELRGDLARGKLRDCALAEPSYRELARSASRERRARATAWLGLCAAGEGRRDEARGLLRQALELGLGGPVKEEVELALHELDP